MIVDLCHELDSGYVMYTEAIVLEILGKIHLWSNGNPNSRIFVPLPDDQNLAWQSFCAVIKSLYGKNEDIFYYSSASNVPLSHAA